MDETMQTTILELLSVSCIRLACVSEHSFHWQHRRKEPFPYRDCKQDIMGTINENIKGKGGVGLYTQGFGGKNCFFFFLF